jgi:large-conductance mechanosensitive channel
MGREQGGNEQQEQSAGGRGRKATPLLGNIIAVFGFLVAAAGLVLLVVSLVVWMAGRHRGNQTRPKSEDEALLQSIRDDGHRDRPV